MTKELPLFLEPSFGRLAGDLYVRPLPPGLMRQVGDLPEGQHHAGLAESYGAARTRATALAAELEKAQAADREGERRAAAAGRKAPRPKAAAVEAEIDETARQLVVLDELLRQSAAALLRVAAPLVHEAEETTGAAIALKLDAVREALLAAQARLSEAEALSGEAGWLYGLRVQGTVYPWRNGQIAQPLPQTREAIGRALAVFDEDQVVAGRNREQAERLREHDEAQTLPAGTKVWRAGRTLVATESGELIEQGKVER